MAAPWYNVFVGSETGLLKGVNTDDKYFKNVNDFSDAGRPKEICAMCWVDSKQTEICCGLKNRQLKIYNTRSRSFDPVLEVTGGEGPIRSVIMNDGNFITCVESGLVKLWKENEPEEEKIEFEVGANVYQMKQNPQDPFQIATGGKENELKIWDLNSPTKPAFMAKNVPYDFLDHRVPVWVTDMQFYPDGRKLVTCTGYHHIRLYDKSAQRRPVMNIEFDEYPLTALSLTNRENMVIVGNSHGRMALFDLRRGLLVHSYKGFAGSIRSVVCHPTEPLVASCGLDRFLRVHDVNSRTLLHKVYLKSRLNCLLFRSTLQDHAQMEVENIEKLPATEEIVEKCQDDLWDRLEVVKDKEIDHQKINVNPKPARKLKKKVNSAKKESTIINSEIPTAKKKKVSFEKKKSKGNSMSKKKSFSKKMNH